MTELPPITVTRWHRLRTWRAHRRLHGVLMDRLQWHGGTGDTMRCVHCGTTWRLCGNHYTGATWLETVR